MTRIFLVGVLVVACGGDFEALQGGDGEDGGGDAFVVESGGDGGGEGGDAFVVEAPVEGDGGSGGGGELDSGDVDGEVDAEASVAIDAVSSACPAIHVVRVVFGSNCDETDGCPGSSTCTAYDATEIARNGSGPSTPCENQRECVYYAGEGCSTSTCATQGCPRMAVAQYDCRIGTDVISTHTVVAGAFNIEAWGQPLHLLCGC